MVRKILVATTNLGKRREILSILKEYEVEVLFPEEDLKVEEGSCSFLDNAYLKAKAYYEAYKIPTLAEDSGLVVPSLDGYPGVYSNRFYDLEWGGREEPKEGKDRANINKLLRLMEGKQDRRAYYVAFAVLFIEYGGLWSEGRCYGTILQEPVGEGGFGYDPIFQPEGFQKSMAELSMEEKNLISHRGKALRRIMQMLK